MSRKIIVQNRLRIKDFNPIQGIVNTIYCEDFIDPPALFLLLDKRFQYIALNQADIFKFHPKAFVTAPGNFSTKRKRFCRIG